MRICSSGFASRSAGKGGPRQGNIGGFVLGTTLGLVWTPCAGPVLGSILTIVATSKDTAWASTQLIVYAIGAAIPMLPIAFGAPPATTPLPTTPQTSPTLPHSFS